MTPKELVKQRYPMAEAIQHEGEWVIVGPRQLPVPTCPVRLALSAHCRTPEAAWASAARRLKKGGSA